MKRLQCLIVSIFIVLISILQVEIYAFDKSSTSECEAVIDSLLYQHDLCERGVIRPDSAIYFTVSALQLADNCYGMDSKEYSDIFTDYFMSDISGNKEMILNQLYPTVTQLFDPSSSFGWRPYYKLGNLLEMHGESEKAATIFNIVTTSSNSAKGRARAGMELAKIKQREDGSDLEEAYRQYMDDIASLESPDKENILMEVAIDLSDYYFSINDEVRALEYISNGERLTGHVSAHKTMRLLRKKYDYLVKHNHLEAVECLNYVIDLVNKQDAGQDDKDWIAVALIDRGDYALNELCNASQACSYYIKAFNLIYTPKTNYNSKAISMILRRLVHLLTLNGDYDDAIQLGEMYLDAVSKNRLAEPSLFVAVDLMEAYLRNGDVQKAAEKFDIFKDALYSDESMIEKTLLMECKILMAGKDYRKASEKLRSLLDNAERRDVRMWAQRLLATAYSCLGDVRTGEISDNINITTKELIGQQFWFISPAERKNWLDFCEEAVVHQLSLDGCEQAVRNAADLNLFRKSLLFRTDIQIEKIVAQNPEASAHIDSLNLLRQAYVEAINQGDSQSVNILLSRLDSLRQTMTNRYVDAEMLAKDIDADIDDAIANLGEEGVAVDFISISTRDNDSTGAFVYSRHKQPVYVSLPTYTDQKSSDYADEIWKLLQPEIKDYRNVYFCADGFLNTLPIEFSKSEINNASTDCWNIHRFFHLARIQDPQKIGEMIAFIGIEDYLKEKSENSVSESWASLHGTNMELSSIKTHFPSASVVAILDKDATEENVRKLDKSMINTLHLSSHGMFRTHDFLVKAKDSLPSVEHSLASHWLSVSEGPLSGIILQYNGIISNNEDIQSDSDGILTAEEIELLSFPKLNLTVLSACDTGLGEIDAEGVWGLQRAFRIAGTKNLICSLNKVDDYWTAQFMDAFYEQAASGNNIYDSFHAAQRWLRQELPDNPEIWSSFILIE